MACSKLWSMTVEKHSSFCWYKKCSDPGWHKIIPFIERSGCMHWENLLLFQKLYLSCQKRQDCIFTRCICCLPYIFVYNICCCQNARGQVRNESENRFSHHSPRFQVAIELTRRDHSVTTCLPCSRGLERVSCFVVILCMSQWIVISPSRIWPRSYSPCVYIGRSWKCFLFVVIWYMFQWLCDVTATVTDVYL